jgi:hypothetical protein
VFLKQKIPDARASGITIFVGYFYPIKVVAEKL